MPRASRVFAYVIIFLVGNYIDLKIDRHSFFGELVGQFLNVYNYQLKILWRKQKPCSLLAFTWNKTGTRLEHTWNTPGTYLEHNWHITGTYLEHNWNTGTPRKNQKIPAQTFIPNPNSAKILHGLTRQKFCTYSILRNCTTVTVWLSRDFFLSCLHG